VGEDERRGKAGWLLAPASFFPEVVLFFLFLFPLLAADRQEGDKEWNRGVRPPGSILFPLEPSPPSSPPLPRLTLTQG